MDAPQLVQRLRRLGAEDIDRLATMVRAGLDSADGEVAWWRANLAVGAALRASHRSRQAAIAAHRAAEAVVAAAARAGLAEDRRDDVTLVARAAAEAARALVLDPGSVPACDVVVGPWEHALAA